MNREKFLKDWYDRVANTFHTECPIDFDLLKDWDFRSIVISMYPEPEYLSPYLWEFAVQEDNIHERIIVCIAHALLRFAYANKDNDLHAILVATQATLMRRANQIYKFDGIPLTLLQQTINEHYSGSNHYKETMEVVRMWISFEDIS